MWQPGGQAGRAGPGGGFGVGLGQLTAGRTHEQLLDDYPYLEREDITAALEYAAAIVNEREVPMARPARGSCSTRTSRRSSSLR